MPSGVTNLMRNIRRPAPEWVHEHTGANRGQRRMHAPKGPNQFGVMQSGATVYRSSTNTPYVNPMRDLKRHARLRGSKRQ